MNGYSITTDTRPDGAALSAIRPWGEARGAAVFMTTIRPDGALLAGVIAFNPAILWATDFADVEGNPVTADVAPSALINGF